MFDPVMIELVTKGGIVGLCVFTVIIGWKREIRQARSFEKLNERNQEVHEKTITQLSALNANTVALHNEIRSRPCVNEEQWNGRDRRKGPHQ